MQATISTICAAAKTDPATHSRARLTGRGGLCCGGLLRGYLLLCRRCERERGREGDRRGHRSAPERGQAARIGSWTWQVMRGSRMRKPWMSFIDRDAPGATRRPREGTGPRPFRRLLQWAAPPECLPLIGYLRSAAMSGHGQRVRSSLWPVEYSGTGSRFHFHRRTSRPQR
jgi:hypothetical protein